MTTIAAPVSVLRKICRSARLFLGAAVLAARLAAAPQFVSEPELVDRVIELMDRCLALMPEAAAVKFRQQQPIADHVRENVVLEQSVADAPAMNLDGPGGARVFLRPNPARAGGAGALFRALAHAPGEQRPPC